MVEFVTLTDLAGLLHWICTECPSIAEKIN